MPKPFNLEGVKNECQGPSEDDLNCLLRLRVDGSLEHFHVKKQGPIVDVGRNLARTAGDRLFVTTVTTLAYGATDVKDHVMNANSNVRRFLSLHSTFCLSMCESLDETRLISTGNWPITLTDDATELQHLASARRVQSHRC